MLEPVHELGLILVLGAMLPWLGVRIGIPPLLLLLTGGLLLGPGVGLLRPAELFGELLLPLVSFGVALIMFEGGLGLQLVDLRRIGPAVRNMATTGVVVSWVLSAVVLRLTTRMPVQLCILLGAVLVVTGPTVILPLLRQVNLRPPLGNVLRWEAMVNDPVGAVLAVLVFEAILWGGRAGAAGTALAQGVVLGLLMTLAAGVCVGLVVGRGVLRLLCNGSTPDHLRAPTVLGLVLISFLVANYLVPEAGLVAVTVEGVVLANQDRCPVRQVIHFQENLGTLMLAILFLLLSAQVRPEQLARIDVRCLAVVFLLVGFVRPVSVFVASVGTGLSWRERAYLAAMAPRGVVALAVTSVFALRLESEGVPGADRLMPVMLVVIFSTVSIYCLLARPLARLLGVLEGERSGALILGANRFGLSLAKALRGVGVPVVLADTNRRALQVAERAGVPTYHGSMLSDQLHEEIDFEGLGCLLAVTSNDEVNSLAGLHLAGRFGRDRVFQLPPDEGERAPLSHTSRELRGKYLFAGRADLFELIRRLKAGHELVATPLDEEHGFASFLASYGESALPLLVVRPRQKLEPFTLETALHPGKGGTLVAMIPPQVGRPRGQAVFEEALQLDSLPPVGVEPRRSS
jgi:NhaP-type Na+/H+ or K+/H+ antiporter